MAIIIPKNLHMMDSCEPADDTKRKHFLQEQNLPFPF